MTWADFLTAFFVSLPATIAAITAAVVALRNGRKVEEVHTAINSRMDELLVAEKSVSRDAGRAEGAATRRDRKDD